MARRLLLALWIGIGINLLGQVVDTWWHAGHGSHFRSASQQVQAHWVVWLSIAVVIAVTTMAVRRGYAEANPGFAWALVAAVVYALGSAWNFREHAQGRHAIPPHVLMTVARVAVLVCAVWILQGLYGREEPHAVGVFKGVRK